MGQQADACRYYYYFATCAYRLPSLRAELTTWEAAGYKVWWKKYLTTLQITQFVLDLGVVYFAGA